MKNWDTYKKIIVIILIYDCMNSVLDVYRMWVFQYSRIRMRILHFNIRGYRMRILYILLYVLGLWKWVSATDDEENSENYSVIKLMNEWKCN